MPTEMNLRVDEVKEYYVHCSLFMNDKLCGKLTLKVDEYQMLGACILLGMDQVKKSLVCKSEEHSKLIKWTKDEYLIDKSDDSKFVKWIEQQKGGVRDD